MTHGKSSLPLSSSIVWPSEPETSRKPQFIASYDTPPDELILDFDATDDPTHGRQEGRFFHGYYDHYCFLPLYVFCGDQLLVSYLRPSNIDGAKHAWAILALLVKRFRQVWPGDTHHFSRGQRFLSATAVKLV